MMKFKCCDDINVTPGGWLADRLQNNLDHWLLTAPYANPGMLEKLRMREYSNQSELMMWYGEFAGKYLTAAAASERLIHSDELCTLVKRIMAILQEAQGEDGYLGPFNHTLRVMGTQEKHNWDMWGHYHLILGLLAWYDLYGWRQALDISVRIADYFVNFFDDKSVCLLDAGWSEMNLSMLHGMGLIYQKTQDIRYLCFMRKIENILDNPQAGGYITGALEGKAFYQLRKPRWESLHVLQGILLLYEITGEEKYADAFVQLWRSIRDFDVHNTGGFSSGEQACGDPYDQGAIETCCSVAWSVLSVDMLRLTGSSVVADELEKTLYNAILGAQNPSGRWFTYNTPMDGERKASAHEIVFQAIAGSPELNCCAVNGPRGLAIVSEWMLMQSDDAYVLNYLGPCVYSIADTCTLTVRTQYPLENVINIHIDSRLDKKLLIRIPGWSKANQVDFNDGSKAEAIAGSYLCVDNTRHGGVRLTLDFSIRAEEGEGACAGKKCFYYGPLLMAQDEAYIGHRLEDMPDITGACLHSLPCRDSAHRLVTPAVLRVLQDEAGAKHVLCDFASAGMNGGRYRSWIPCN